MPIKMICFDVDGTLLDDGDGSLNIWSQIHRRIGTPDSLNEERFQRFMNREITYAEWVDLDVGEWQEQGVPEATLRSVASELQLMPGARETVNELERRGYDLCVISGSLNIGIETAFPDHPFDPVFINRVFFDHGRISGWKATPFDMQEKQVGLGLIADQKGCRPDECAFIGDNFNDVEIAVAAGFSIAFNSKSENLDAVADVKVPGKDLRRVLEHFPGRG